MKLSFCRSFSDDPRIQTTEFHAELFAKTGLSLLETCRCNILPWCVALCVCVPLGLVLSVPGFLSRGGRNELCSCAAKLLLPRVTEVYRNVKEELNRVRVWNRFLWVFTWKTQISGMVANAYLDNAYILNVFLRFRGFHSKEPWSSWVSLCLRKTAPLDWLDIWI